MSENFNVKPYFDDFDPTKNFHRILFRPGYAVQARELTQSQTILQDQISKFANHIFTQNTPISGGKVTTNLNCYYIKLNYQYGGVNIVAGSFLNKTIQDSTGTTNELVREAMNIAPSRRCSITGPSFLVPSGNRINA